jgi:hypothetical protein
MAALKSCFPTLIVLPLSWQRLPRPPRPLGTEIAAWVGKQSPALARILAMTNFLARAF